MSAIGDVTRTRWGRGRMEGTTADVEQEGSRSVRKCAAPRFSNPPGGVRGLSVASLATSSFRNEQHGRLDPPCTCRRQPARLAATSHRLRGFVRLGSRSAIGAAASCWSFNGGGIGRSSPGDGHSLLLAAASVGRRGRGDQGSARRRLAPGPRSRGAAPRVPRRGYVEPVNPRRGRQRQRAARARAARERRTQEGSPHAGRLYGATRGHGGGGGARHLCRRRGAGGSLRRRGVRGAPRTRAHRTGRRDRCRPDRPAAQGGPRRGRPGRGLRRQGPFEAGPSGPERRDRFAGGAAPRGAPTTTTTTDNDDDDRQRRRRLFPPPPQDRTPSAARGSDLPPISTTTTTRCCRIGRGRDRET